MAGLRDLGLSGGGCCVRELLEVLCHEFERLEAENQNLRDAVSLNSNQEGVPPDNGDDAIVSDEVLSASSNEHADDPKQLHGHWVEGVGWVDASGRKPEAPATNPPTMMISNHERQPSNPSKRAWATRPTEQSATSTQTASSKAAASAHHPSQATSQPVVELSSSGRVIRVQSSTSLEGSNPRRAIFNRHSVGPMFPDADDMKKVVKGQLHRKKKYRVEHLYKDHGMWQEIARSHWFENVTIAVIGLNAIWIAVDTDHNNAEMLLDAHPVFMVAEQFFCFFFTIELLIRLLAFRQKRYSLTDAWFVFDLSLVCLMITESWILVLAAWILAANRSGGRHISNASILKLAKLLRLMRMLRISRLMRTMPEFSIILKALSAAFRAVFFTLVFLVVILYVFAIAFTSTLKGTDMEDAFPNVLESMQRLFFQVALFDDILELVLDISKTDWFILFLTYALATLAGITIMNMLIGVLCEAVQAVADSERTSLHIVRVQESLKNIISREVDQDHDGLISKDEFMRLISSQEAVVSLENIGVDVVGLVDIADTIFANRSFVNPGDKGGVETYDKRITFEEFMDVLLQLRGSNKATVRDIVEVRKEIRIGMRKLEKIGSFLSNFPLGHSTPSIRQLPKATTRGLVAKVVRSLPAPQISPKTRGPQLRPGAVCWAPHQENSDRLAFE